MRVTVECYEGRLSTNAIPGVVGGVANGVVKAVVEGALKAATVAASSWHVVGTKDSRHSHATEGWCDTDQELRLAGLGG